MANVGIESYRQHPVWKELKLKRDALESVRFSTEEAEMLRGEYVFALSDALASRDSPVPFLYDDVLNELHQNVSALAGDEASFSHFRALGLEGQLRSLVRQLPARKAERAGEQYLAALDSAIAARESEVSALREAASALSAKLQAGQTELREMSRTVAKHGEKISADAATISQVTAVAAEQIERDWGNHLASWETARDAKDLELDKRLDEHIGLLANAAAVGQRLVEHAAGRLTATEWTQRASRERVSATRLRLGSLAFFVGALGIGGYILWQAVDRGFDLTVGDGILRGALVVAIVGAGTFLTAEARRHFREADSAEEVALALVAIEPFYAGADAPARASAREAVGDTVFVKNVLSRFSSRDAAKHGSVTNAQMSEILDLLTKSAELAKRVPEN